MYMYVAMYICRYHQFFKTQALLKNMYNKHICICFPLNVSVLYEYTNIYSMNILKITILINVRKLARPITDS